jgi:hypothetical protein
VASSKGTIASSKRPASSSAKAPKTTTVVPDKSSPSVQGLSVNDPEAGSSGPVGSEGAQAAIIIEATINIVRIDQKVRDVFIFLLIS